MKKKIIFAIESSEPFTGRQLIGAVLDIQKSAKDLGLVEEPTIDTHGTDGVYKVRGVSEIEVDL